MKHKRRTRFLSALLALVMLVSLMPAAFAASSSYNYGSFSGETNSDGYCYLINDAGFNSESLYVDRDALYFTIEANESDAPGIYHNDYRYDVEGVVFYYRDLTGIYFDEYDSDCDQAYYSYIIEAYEDEDCDDYVGYMTFKLYVNGSSNSFTDGKIYAETDSSGYLDMDDIAKQLYTYGYYSMSIDIPESVEFTSCTNGYLFYGSAYKDAEDIVFDFIYSGAELDQYVYFEIWDESKEAEIEFTIYGDGTQKAYGTIIVNSGGSASSIGDIYAETDSYGYLDMSGISDKIYDYAYDELWGDPYYVRFWDWDNGTMYDGRSETSVSDYYYFDEDDVWYSYEYYLDDAWFEIDDPYEEAEITFAVYDNYGYYVNGTIIVNGATSSGSINYYADYNCSVSFDGSDFEDLLSSSQTLSYVTFTLPSSSKGTLYWDGYKLDSDDHLYSSELDDVSFTPKSGFSGSVSIPFKLYYTTGSSSRTYSMSGAVVITVDDGSTVSYTGEIDKKVAFDSGDFDGACYEVTGRDLLYVKFTLPASSKGTLYAKYDGTSLGSTAAKSSSKFYLDPDDGEYALDDVVFVPAASGAIELTYTAYNTRGDSYTGKVKITVSAGTLDPINYTVSSSSFISNNSVTFSASDFTNALKARTSRTLSSVTFTLPKATEGILVYDSSNTRVSAATQYKATGSTNLLDKVSFVPASGVTDDVTIAYTARDSSGNAYNGAIVIKTFVGQDTVLSYSTAGPAVSFSASDFINACAKKLNTTLDYVQFILPSAAQGRLYYGYGSSQQTPVSSTAKYTAGTHLDYVSFLPKAGFSGVATLLYFGYDTTGESYAGYIQILVTPPAQSSSFTDANEGWIAPAADFLNSYNVYSGMVSGATLGVRNPITRGEVMQMIYNAFDLKSKVPVSTAGSFPDVPADYPYRDAISAGKALQITLGDTDGNFRPDDLITREEAITLLYRAFTTLGLDLTPGAADDLKAFGDYDQVYAYAVDALASMIKSGIIQGNENGDINPKGNLTRGEMSVILYRALTL